ncbi:transcription initiation factor TFIID subunit 10 isoform X2 [Petromyzon marinus]|uniref:Transcription initiation factor TFIID subunit 10 n=2 Tax=Petromyzon marinus TaxID=7757 RepID=A0AAJ7X7F4_PETMA|nr:transcription initiation factor TFIID subunit 10 [Petromyzon marinus]
MNPARSDASPCSSNAESESKAMIIDGLHGGGSSAHVNGDRSHVDFPALNDLLQNLEDYTPTVPDAVTGYYLNRAGFETTDPRIIRLISLAAQKFISDIANDALQHCRMKGTTSTTSRSKSKEKKCTLTMDDLIPALGDYNINVKKPCYFT